jgi:sulfur carrier protein
MNITLNGKPRSFDAVENVTQLVLALEVKPEQVAVAVNGDVVRRREWPDTPVRPGDVIEIVRAVGGGAR